MWNQELCLHTPHKGLHLISPEVKAALPQPLPSGLLHIFLQHTSASLLLQENADPSARQDLESFFDRLAPDHQSWHRHTLEGPDDTTSHMKTALTSNSLLIPIVDGQLALGTWQGIYLFEHRQAAQQRRLILSILS